MDGSAHTPDPNDDKHPDDWPVGNWSVDASEVGASVKVPVRETASGVFSKVTPQVGAGFGRMLVADFDRDEAPLPAARSVALHEPKINSGRARVVPRLDADGDKPGWADEDPAGWANEATLETPTVRVSPEPPAPEPLAPETFAPEQPAPIRFVERSADVRVERSVDVRGGRFRLVTVGAAVVIGLIATLVVSLTLYYSGVLGGNAGVENRAGADGTRSGPDAASRGGRNRIVSAPLGDRRELEFNLVNGTTAVSLRSGDLGDRLYVITTPQNGDSTPDVVNQDGRVELHLVPTGVKGPGAVEIQLSSSVRWHLVLTGGAAEHLVDMTAGGLAGIDIAGGATRIELSLPAPTGTVTVRMTGGVSQFVVHAPIGVPTRVRIGSGASSATIDAQTRSGIAPGTVFTPKEWDAAGARYDIDAAAGVAAIRVDRDVATVSR